MNADTVLTSSTLPDAIQTLTLTEKKALASAVRERIIHVVSQRGGHLASSLGTVELTIALLAQLDFLYDRIVWDVGHQTYPWKILTGRNALFDTLRSYGGIAGFLTPKESPYDHFTAGHASTSISAALGIAIAHRKSVLGEEQPKRHVVAVIGDGALTGGLALEALNQIAFSGVKLIIVLNDNTFSISGNVGSLSRFISRTLSAESLRKIKESIKSSVGGLAEGKVLDYLRKGERSVKGLLTPGMLFEALQLNYIGPIDGHDIDSLERHIAIAKKQERSVVLHVATVKGKGFPPAEADPVRFHGVGAFAIEDTNVVFQKKDTVPSYTSVFARTMCTLLRKDPRIQVITAAMPEGTGVATIANEFPTHCLDVGICEPHAVTMAAGMAIEGERPFVAIYSTFLQRAYDQILHDVCLQNLPVVFCIDRAGLVGEDGATHHGIFDIAYLRSIPNMHILVPKDENELQHALHTALYYTVPIAIRYERGAGVGVAMEDTLRVLQIAEPELICKGEDVLILAVGSIVHVLQEILEEFTKEHAVRWTLINVRWIKPLPSMLLKEHINAHTTVVCVEEATVIGGLGSAVCELVADMQAFVHVVRMGIHDIFVEHGSKDALLDAVGLSKQKLKERLRSFIPV